MACGWPRRSLFWVTGCTRDMWLVWQVTHSAFLMGLAAVAESVPYVVAGVSGRRLVAWFGSLGRLAMVDAARAVLVAVVPLTWGSGGRIPVLLARVAGPASAGVMAWLARRGRRGTRAAASVPRVAAVRARELLRADARLLAAIGMHGAGVMASALPAIAMPVLLTVRLHASAGGYGLVMAAAGLGALAGNPVAGNLRLGSRFPAAYFAAWVATGAVLAATGQATSVLVVAVLAFAGGLAAPVSAVSLSTYLARHYPRPERLRLAAADQAVIRACGTCGMLVLPALAAAHPSAGFTAAGLVTVVLAAAGLAVVPRLPASAVPHPGSEHDPAAPAGAAAA